MTSYAEQVQDLENLLVREEPVAWPPLAATVHPFPVNVLPPVGREMVEAVAESVQVSPDMAACFLLGAVSTAALGKYTVEVKPGWFDPVHLFIVVSAAPSERKSPAMVPFFGPLEAWIQQENERLRGDVAASRARKKALETSLKRATDKGDLAEVDRISREVDAFAEVRPVEALLTDATPEALACAMARNGGAVAFKSAEGGLFNILSGAYSEVPNLDVFLQGYTGEAVAVERVGREGVRLSRSALSITLAVQPDPLSRFTTNEVMLGRGLCARFLYSAPPSRIGERSFDTRPIPFAVRELYRQRVQALMAAPCGEAPAVLTLQAAATEAMRAWYLEVEDKIRRGGPWCDILGGWEGKAVGNTARVAALLKLLDEPDAKAPIDARHVRAAVEIMRFFIAQAIAIGGTANGLSSAARQVLQVIRQRGEAAFSPSSMRQRLRDRKQFERGEAVDAALRELDEAGYLRLDLPPEPSGRGGRPAQARWLVHPGLFEETQEGEVIEL